jgi:hypothetical protein
MEMGSQLDTPPPRAFRHAVDGPCLEHCFTCGTTTGNYLLTQARPKHDPNDRLLYRQCAIRQDQVSRFSGLGFRNLRQLSGTRLKCPIEEDHGERLRWVEGTLTEL